MKEIRATMASAEDQPDSGSGSVDAVRQGEGAQQEQGVGELAELYLGNILYALERCAMSFDAEERAEHAAFYRGIARKLAVAHGRRQGPDTRVSGPGT